MATSNTFVPIKIGNESELEELECGTLYLECLVVNQLKRRNSCEMPKTKSAEIPAPSPGAELEENEQVIPPCVSPLFNYKYGKCQRASNIKRFVVFSFRGDFSPGFIAFALSADLCALSLSRQPFNQIKGFPVWNLFVADKR